MGEGWWGGAQKRSPQLESMSMNKTRDSGLGGIPFAQRPVTGHGTAIAAALRSYKDFQQNSVAANKVRDLPHAPTGSVEPWTAPLTPSVKATNERIVSLCLANRSFSFLVGPDRCAVDHPAGVLRGVEERGGTLRGAEEGGKQGHRRRSRWRGSHGHQRLHPDVSNTGPSHFRSLLANSYLSLSHTLYLKRWIRTTVNFQYRYGMSTSEALRHLYKDGGGGITGLTRFYRGYFPALMQGPLARFGDTAANAGVMAYFDSYEETQELPVLVKTLGASAAASGMRIFLMPIDAWKTTKQVEGAAGLSKLVAKVRTNGPTVLWHGALGAASATFVGHYPWWSVYNALNEYLPQYDRKTDFASYLGRSALIGFCASVTSDSISNPIRVLKTYRQTSAEKISYAEAAKAVIAKEGFGGFWTRGLSTKIVANGLQGIMFSVGYKYFTELIFSDKK